MGYNTLLEYTFSDTLRKQKTISQQFPTFDDRVDAVKAAGGVRLQKIEPDRLTFKVASVSNPGGWYTVKLGFLNPIFTLQDLIERDREVWASEENEDALDYNILAQKFLARVDLLWDCTCPADLYWGYEYIRTDKGAQADHEENRPPKIRNPRQYGFGCKHLDLVWRELAGTYLDDVERFIRKYYARWIDGSIEKMQKDRKAMKAGAEELRKKEDEQAMKKQAEQAQSKRAEELRKEFAKEKGKAEEPKKEAKPEKEEKPKEKEKK
jgi:hypothetical protein